MRGYKPIAGHETYLVNKLGGIINTKFRHRRPIGFRGRHGYRRVALCKDKKRYFYFIHRIVYQTFVGPIPPNMYIDHINRLKDDNRLENLRLVTIQENNHNRYY